MAVPCFNSKTPNPTMEPKWVTDLNGAWKAKLYILYLFVINGTFKKKHNVEMHKIASYLFISISLKLAFKDDMIGILSWFYRFKFLKKTFIRKRGHGMQKPKIEISILLNSNEAYLQLKFIDNIYSAMH